MIDIYGPDNGFGWNLDEIIGARIVTAPLQAPLDRARETFIELGGGIVSIVMIVAMLVRLPIDHLVIALVRTMIELANDIGAASLEGGEFLVEGHDEKSELAMAFNRMRCRFDRVEPTKSD